MASAAATESASNAAQESAKATLEANRMAHQRWELDKCAHIHIENVEFRDMKSANPIVVYELYNSGEVPATGVWVEFFPGFHDVDPSQEKFGNPRPEGYGEIISAKARICRPYSLTGQIRSTDIGSREGRPSPFEAAEWQNLIQEHGLPQIGLCVSYYNGFGKSCHSDNWYYPIVGTDEWILRLSHQYEH